MNIVKPKSVNSAFVVLLPIVYIVVYLLIGNQKGPYYWTPNQDPDYAYLANSLLLSLFQVPSHTDHPGTPLQMLGALTIWVGHFFRSLFNPALPKDAATDVLTDPEPFLHLFNFVLLLLTAIALVALGWVAYRLTRSLLLVLLLQISPFLMIKTHLGGEPSRVSPDVLVFCISQLLALVLVQYLYTENAGKLRGFALRLGAVFGLGMATKVTFIPMLLFFLLPRGWKNKAWALGAAIVAFVVFTLPIISQYNRMFRWLTGIATSTEAYGGGDAGLVATDNLGRNLYLLVTRNLVFFGILLTATIVSLAIAALWHRWSRTAVTDPAGNQSGAGRPHFRKIYALLVITSLVMWGQVALTINEQPQSRYLDPSAGLMGFLVLLLVQAGLVMGATTGRRLPNVNVAIPAIALALCVLLSAQQADASIDQIAPQAKKRATELNKIENILERDQYRSCAILLSRRASTIESALKFADFWAGKKLASRLQPLYPDSTFYIAGKKGFESFSKPVSLEAMVQRGNGCILLETNASPPQSRKARVLPEQGIEKVFEGRHEAVYRLKTS